MNKNSEPDGAGFSNVKNKQKASLMRQERMQDKKRKAREARKERQEAGGERQVPRTIEMMRRDDETIVPPSDEEVEGDEAIDEFEKYFTGTGKPKLKLTTCAKPKGEMFNLLKELVHVMPNMFYYKRDNHPLKKIVEYAKSKNFTDLLIFSQRAKKPSGLYICHLPDGPTSYWKLTNLKL